MKKSPPPGDLERAAALAAWRLPQGRGQTLPIDSPLQASGSWRDKPHLQATVPTKHTHDSSAPVVPTYRRPYYDEDQRVA
jgi:hypothetical protein